MIKKVMLAAVLLAPMCLSAQRIGVVDSKAIFDVMPDKIEAESRINTLLAQYQEENTKLEKEFNQKYADFQALDPATPKSIRAMRMQEIQENQRKISSYQQMVNQDVETKKAELLNPIKARIQAAIDSVSNAGGYMLVFDISKTPVAFKSADVIDITPEVKNCLGVVE